ncbi:MAG: DUF4012 domain-containing protein [Parcubacteria group bacterium]|jgi:hypothetical protein
MKKKIEKTLIAVVLIILVVSVGYFFTKREGNTDKILSPASLDILTLAKSVLSGKKVFLVLFQNNMELRPGGGFIGSFAIVRAEKGKVTSYEIHDTSNFDGRIPENNDMPEPMKKIFKINSWKFRDSNYSPDYPSNVQKALDFYYQGKGEEKFDGVIAINASVLENVLKFTGPIKLEKYPVSFESGSALLTLEKQVEIDFSKQGIDRGDRKDIMSDFLDEVLKKTLTLPKLDKVKLAESLMKDLTNKNLQLYFNNKEEQALVEKLGWSGEVDKDWKDDYLMVVDANIGAYKSDYFIKRSMNYSLDLTKDVPEATLRITYNHTAKEKNWFARNYLTYLRLYLPKGAVITNFSNNTEVSYGEEFNKKIGGSFIEVPINSNKTIEIKYNLPKEFKDKDYRLKIQKQSGSGIVPTVVDVRLANGENLHLDLNLDKDEIVAK